MPALPDLRDLVAAQRALLRARHRVAREPIGTLVLSDRSGAGRITGDPVRARDLARALTLAADYGLFRPLCLVRALALHDLLIRHGIHGSEIRVGVRTRDGNFAAHAWVRWQTEILGDDPAHVASFTEVDDIRVLAPR